ncbi:MAG: fatty acid-binding protein DegV [Chloroflexi bacterium RBG_16_60_22]|nr:MAG: fatty acid-binding protein DegV [Chloroflexi bacterium RBG_16_60_22]
MTVKIVTDSLSDITEDLARELGLTVVPLYVRFGEDIYRDRVDITTEEFYRRLVTESTLPSTTQPTPNDFLEVYQKLAKETDEILVIVVSSKLSGTYQSATQAKQMVSGKCRIEIIDSLSVAMGQGLIAISSAEAVKKGASLEKAADLARQAVSRSHLIAYFDTLKYLAKGGRIGKASGLLGSMLSVKPILTIKEGEMSPLTRVRSMSAGLDYMYGVIAGYGKVEALAVEHSTTPDDADALVERLGALFPRERIRRSIISPVVGTYAGPKALALTFLEAAR